MRLFWLKLKMRLLLLRTTWQLWRAGAFDDADDASVFPLVNEDTGELSGTVTEIDGIRYVRPDKAV